MKANTDADGPIMGSSAVTSASYCQVDTPRRSKRDKDKDKDDDDDEQAQNKHVNDGWKGGKGERKEADKSQS